MFKTLCGMKLELTHLQQAGYIEVKLQVLDVQNGTILMESECKLFPNVTAYLGPFKGIADIGFTRIELPINWQPNAEVPQERTIFEPEDISGVEMEQHLP